MIVHGFINSNPSREKDNSCIYIYIDKKVESIKYKAKGQPVG